MAAAGVGGRAGDPGRGAAATKATPPETSTLWVVPGIGTRPRRTGEKVLTVPSAWAAKPLLVIVIVQAPSVPAKIRPGSAPKLQVARSLEA